MPIGFARAIITASTVAADPTYSVSPSASNVDEGSSVTFTVTTTNISNGTTLYYNVERTSGSEPDANDFTAINGSFTITNNSGSFTVTAYDDSETESDSEYFVAKVRTDSVSGTVVATSASVGINDTSQAAAQVREPASGQRFSNQNPTYLVTVAWGNWQYRWNSVSKANGSGSPPASVSNLDGWTYYKGTLEYDGGSLSQQWGIYRIQN